jgi:hypothetical protein
MADHPARRGYDPAGEDTGWGSPMPAEYGSLTAFLPPLEEAKAENPGPDPRAQSRWRPGRATTSRDAAAVSANGPVASPAPSAARSSAPPASPASRSAPTEPDRSASDYPSTPTIRGRSVQRTTDIPPGSGPLVGGPGATAPPVVGRPGRRDRPLDSEPLDATGRRRRRRRAERAQWAQSRRTVRHLNIWSVTKVSLVFYLMVLVAVVVASVMLWYVANAFGSITSIEKSVKTLFDLSKFTLHPKSVAEYTAIGGGVVALAGTITNILAALMYNLISDLVGGLRFDVVDDAR